MHLSGSAKPRRTYARWMLLVWPVISSAADAFEEGTGTHSSTHVRATVSLITTVACATAPGMPKATNSNALSFATIVIWCATCLDAALTAARSTAFTKKEVKAQMHRHTCICVPPRQAAAIPGYAWLVTAALSSRSTSHRPPHANSIYAGTLPFCAFGLRVTVTLPPPCVAMHSAAFGVHHSTRALTETAHVYATGTNDPRCATLESVAVHA